LLVVTESMRPLIMNRAPASNIAAHAIAEGMKTLRMAGWERVLHPERPTTIEEVLRVTQVEEHLAALLGDEKN
jgi:type II secretory ATPase GspE/PulE/Tfp pilus assembly ATPase PilB-like protein